MSDYWDNRKAGVRGQGPKPRTIKVLSTTGVNRKMKRARVIDRHYTKPNWDLEDEPVPHVSNDYRHQREVVAGTNHERMLARKAARNGSVNN